jgi:hypothetical protein
VSDKGLLSSKTIGDSGCGLYACSIVGYRRAQGICNSGSGGLL